MVHQLLDVNVGDELAHAIIAATIAALTAALLMLIKRLGPPDPPP